MEQNYESKLFGKVKALQGTCLWANFHSIPSCKTYVVFTASSGQQM